MSGKRTLQGKSTFKLPVTGIFSAGFIRKNSIRIESSA